MVLLVSFSILSFSAKVKYSTWKKGLTFEKYLKNYNISKDILETLDQEDELLVSDIEKNQKFYELIASNGVLLQALIPVGEELQLHLRKTYKSYDLKIIPIAYQKSTYVTLLSITKNPHSDILHKVKNRRLANEFIRLLKDSVNFRGIQKGDKLAIIYDQKMRLGQPIGIPDIKVAMLESHGKKKLCL